MLGTKLIFDSIVNRELTKREKTIDKWLNRIGKARNELVAIIWFEVSRCSIKIFTALMSGGLSAIVTAPPEPSDEALEQDEQDGGGHDAMELDQITEKGKEKEKKNGIKEEQCCCCSDRL